MLVTKPARAKVDPPKDARTRSVVMSVRVWPDVDAGFRELAEQTGLSYAGLLANALELLRADPGTQELIAACKAYDAAFDRIVGAKRKAAAAKA